MTAYVRVSLLPHDSIVWLITMRRDSCGSRGKAKTVNNTG
ncbi:MAG: hypothetical protein BWZ00_00194 [Bacteroidetes bacterium ADurb.BinA174]|jgi:hypothetical protein|nr:MAG: hypothetical protein BWZ00_00194 [Bacteroidetes bacterium ADurb.BinA174]